MVAKVMEATSLIGLQHLLVSDRTNSSKGARRAGLLVGMAAATVGLSSLVPSLGIRPWHMLVAAAFIYVVVGAGKAVGHFRILALDFVFLTFVIISALVELINSRQLSFSPDMISAVSPLFYYAGYLAARIAVSSLSSLVDFLTGLAVPAIPVSFLALFQSLSVEPIASLVLQVAPGPGALARLEEGALTRATSTIGHWTGLGSYLACIVAIVCLLMIIRTRDNKPRGLLLSIILVSALTGLISTLTISSIATGLIILLLSWKWCGFRISETVGLALGVSIATAVTMPLILQRVEQQTLTSSQSLVALPNWIPSTISYRLGIWMSETVPAIGARSLLGWGQGAYGVGESGRIYSPDLLWVSPESQWLGLWIYYGVFGLFTFLLLVFSVGRLVYKLSVAPSGAFEVMLLPFIVLFIMTLAASLTAPIFTNRGFPAAFWPAFGAILGYWMTFNNHRLESQTLSPGDEISPGSS